MSIAFGRGDGSLITASLSTLGHSENYGIATGDFDRDGKNDVAVNDRASGVVVYHGNGDGALQTAALHPVKAGEFLTGDLNGDGVPDLLGQSEVLLGVGDGTFRDGPAAGFVDQIVALADLNGDGKLDLVLRSTANGGIGPVSIMLGQGDGTFRSAHSQPASGNAFDIKLADIDGNGKLDLVVSLHSSFNVLGENVAPGNCRRQHLRRFRRVDEVPRRQRRRHIQARGNRVYDSRPQFHRRRLHR